MLRNFLNKFKKPTPIFDIAQMNWIRSECHRIGNHYIDPKDKTQARFSIWLTKTDNLCTDPQAKYWVPTKAERKYLLKFLDSFCRERGYTCGFREEGSRVALLFQTKKK